MRKIYGKYPEFSRSRIGQRNGYGISLYDFAYVRCNRPQDLPQVKARRDSVRQIEEQLKPLVLTLQFGLRAHVSPQSAQNRLAQKSTNHRFILLVVGGLAATEIGSHLRRMTPALSASVYLPAAAAQNGARKLKRLAKSPPPCNVCIELLPPDVHEFLWRARY